ncbi:MAG: YeiH family protein [Bacteriovoracaceae bacterium]
MIRIFIALTLLIIIASGLAPHWSIALGLILSILFPVKNEDRTLIKSSSARILQISIVLLGAALNFHAVLKDGVAGIALTFFSISFVMILGEVLAKIFKVSSPISHLITVGTGICGGSAIGAIGPVLKADSISMAISLGIVFILNAISVFLFTYLGKYLHLSQLQFGTWAALAIHDTSAVVAASQIYGEEALKIATTLKLTRALWIIPLSLGFTFIKKSENKFSFPWFIIFFLINSLLFTLITDLHQFIPVFKTMAKYGFSMTLFLIGLSVSKDQLKTINLKTIFFGITLWLITLITSLFYVKNYL